MQDFKNNALSKLMLRFDLQIMLPSGCIEELDAEYSGTNVSIILSNTVNGVTSNSPDLCCQLCKYASLLSFQERKAIPDEDSLTSGSQKIWQADAWPAKHMFSANKAQLRSV